MELHNEVFFPPPTVPTVQQIDFVELYAVFKPFRITLSERLWNGKNFF